MVREKLIPTPIPVMTKSSGDSRYYEKYPDSLGYCNGELATEHQLLFLNFDKEFMVIE